VLCVDKANQELRGPEFWKLGQGNCKVVQKNLTKLLIEEKDGAVLRALQL
jgi:streptomycin 6-kinase